MLTISLVLHGSYLVHALSAFKRAIYEDPHSILSDWNTRDGDPCAWSGVACSDPDNRVVSL